MQNPARDREPAHAARRPPRRNPRLRRPRTPAAHPGRRMSPIPMITPPAPAVNVAVRDLFRARSIPCRNPERMDDHLLPQRISIVVARSRDARTQSLYLLRHAGYFGTRAETWLRIWRSCAAE